MNLKLILMELGNRLVTEYGANPQEDPRCVAIQQMMEVLNDSFEARLILEDLSVDWPVVEALWREGGFTMLLNRKATKAFILMVAQDKDTRIKKWSQVSPESLAAAEAALKSWIRDRTNPQNLPRVGRTVKL